MTKDIVSIRRQIDIIDRQLTTLLCRRAILARKIGALKLREKLPIFEPSREIAVLERVERYRREPLDRAGLEAIYRVVMRVMRRLQKTTKKRVAR